MLIIRCGDLALLVPVLAIGHSAQPSLLFLSKHFLANSFGASLASFFGDLYAAGMRLKELRLREVGELVDGHIKWGNPILIELVMSINLGLVLLEYAKSIFEFLLIFREFIVFRNKL